jgi:hypothetical protein
MPQQTALSRTDGATAPGAATVLIKVPADRDYLVLIRSAAAHLGARVGCSVAEITDLRLAVDEACTLLLADRPRLDAPWAAELECRIVVLADALAVTVAAPADGLPTPEADSFGWTILSALVDTLAWGVEDGVARVELLKRRAAGRA